MWNVRQKRDKRLRRPIFEVGFAVIAREAFLQEHDTSTQSDKSITRQGLEREPCRHHKIQNTHRVDQACLVLPEVAEKSLNAPADIKVTVNKPLA